MTFPIESNVPLEEASTGRPLKYPWPDMAPGDSFVVPLDGEPYAKVAHRARQAGRQWCDANRPEVRVTTGQDPEGVRVWMIWRAR